MYFHPLQEEIGNLSDEDISKRIKENVKKAIYGLTNIFISWYIILISVL